MRVSAKAFLLDDDGRILLLDCTDPADPGTRWWELPGGGIEPGESEPDALVREVLEETGIAVAAGSVGPLQWTQDSTFTWLDVRRYARCHGYVARASAQEAQATALTPDERGTILGRRWWTVDEVTAYGGRFFPSTLPALLPRVLAGERIDEPYDEWN